MIVPGNNNPLKSGGPGRSGGNVVPIQRPSETQLLMALAEMHRQGAFDQPAGPETDKEKALGTLRGIERERLNPEHPIRLDNPTDRVMEPGESLPDRERGGTAQRRVKGI